ncbi:MULTISPECIES: hypothetical protein [Bacillus]|uniref:Uncharacterized protein n=1 Tax=Bacillus thuringiensis YBT-1518 TaxID=529122 RepID=A0A9W3KM57_BACTU|nr:hypothetical protein [Bacillus thuringiensis]EKS8366529.1 hypothetical protein [Bacillus cereus]AHA75661.1 hypothetical protein YBT1518_33197 [Bacillus thuringiensis YBT-1518]AHA75812.1 hypothetical protein YBT1518_31705 [Bacillus thuringiensis YBT-1518]MBG9516602.1 hypothetical protein [Bacillus thuringiensis]PGL29009.1 hypothetical protein CN916_18615 [Bacillus thuringiensis]
MKDHFQNVSFFAPEPIFIMMQIPIVKKRNITIIECKAQFWTSPLQEYKNLQFYKADIDTTFAVYNKKFFTNGFYTQ